MSIPDVVAHLSLQAESSAQIKNVQAKYDPSVAAAIHKVALVHQYFPELSAAADFMESE